MGKPGINFGITGFAILSENMALTSGLSDLSSYSARKTLRDLHPPSHDPPKTILLLQITQRTHEICAVKHAT